MPFFLCVLPLRHCDGIHLVSSKVIEEKRKIEMVAQDNVLDVTMTIHFDSPFLLVFLKLESQWTIFACGFAKHCAFAGEQKSSSLTLGTRFGKRRATLSV